MDCKQFREYLDNYASLTAGERAQMTEHAKECEGCRAELEFMTSVIETVNSLPRITPPADFMDKLNARISAEERRQPRFTAYFKEFKNLPQTVRGSGGMLRALGGHRRERKDAYGQYE